jgi:hypothetical protein
MRRTIWARTLVAGAALGLLAAVPAGAAVMPAPSPLAAVQAASSASFVPQSAFNIGGTQTGTPIGIADSGSPRAPFPRDGSTYLVLSTGNATLADQPDQAGTYPSVDDLGGQIRGRGAGALDVTVMQVIFPHPVGGASGGLIAGCLDFDFRFLSEEYPSRLGSAYNDAFVAELDGSSWTTPASLAPGITAPDAFTFGPNKPVTINSASMSPAEAAGTPYGAATAPLQGQVFVSLQPNMPQRQLYFSLFDNGDRLDDSAVFIDNIRITPNATQASCPNGVTSLASAPDITAPSVSATVDTQTPTLQGTASGPGTVTVRLYNGALPAGAPVQTFAATRSGTTWSATAPQPLPNGQYTAQATQSNNGISGFSPPLTFTVAAPRAAPPATGGSSSQQGQGDRDNDGIPDDQDTSDGSLPPVPGKTFDARVVSGSVFVKYPPGTGPRAAVTPLKGFVPLKGAANVPMGAQLDTRKGRVAVTSAHDTSGRAAQTADFYDGVFQVKQSVPRTKPKTPKALITDLVLKGEPPRSECAPIKGASAAAASKKKRGGKSVLGSLWGSGKGKFRTNGKYSSATVRGTIWLTQDRCDGTLTKVKRGIVSVRDFKLRKTVSVKAGHSYLARAASSAKRSR